MNWIFTASGSNVDQVVVAVGHEAWQQALDPGFGVRRASLLGAG